MSTTETIPVVPAKQPAPLPRIDLPETPAPKKSGRLESLDVFRGVTIAAMILVNTQPHPAYRALIHAGEQPPFWNGWTPTDLIFPFFLFIVGVATPFSLGKRAAANATRGTLLTHIWGRAVALFALGELLTGLPYTSFDAIPAGHAWITSLRAITAGFCIVGIVLLLIPWKSVRFSLFLPIALLLIFYLLALVSYQIISRTSGLPEDFHFGNGLLNPLHLRIPGVLQRIGICYGIAATIGLFFGWRLVLVWALAFMAIYTALMFRAHFAGHETGSLAKEDNLARKIDEWLLIRDTPMHHWNHAYEYPDNEGLLSTLPAIAQVLLGLLAGVWLRTFRPAAERGMGLLVVGLLTLLAGLALNKWLMPINKEIWTPSFTVFTTGMALLCLGVCFYFVDVLGHRTWSFPFKVYGMNAIAAYVLYGLVYRLLTVLPTRIVNPEAKTAGATFSVWGYCIHFFKEQIPLLGQRLHVDWIAYPQTASLTFSLSFVIAIGVLMLVLYVSRIFVKV